MYLVSLLVWIDLSQLIFEFRKAMRHTLVVRVQLPVVAVVGVELEFVPSTLFDGGDDGVVAAFGTQFVVSTKGMLANTICLA